MPRIRQIFFVSAVAWTVFAMVAWALRETTTRVVSACPYCPNAEETLTEKLAGSDAAYVVKFLESKNGEELSMQTTTFEVVKSLSSRDPYKKGEKIETTFGKTAKRGDLFILMGQLKAGEMEWSLPVSIDELGSEVSYLQKAPAIDRPQVERLPYFLKYLDHNSQVISNDAFMEFVKSKFEDVVQLAPEISRKKVRGWLEDQDPQLHVRRDFYGMLLGLCGNDDDTVFLEKKLLAPIDPDRFRFGIGGMMGGYLLLRGQNGLRLLIDKKLDSVPKELANDDRLTEDLDGLRRTLVFLWDYRRPQFSEESLRTAMRRFLDHPKFAEIAIIDLSRWKDWSSLDRLIEAYGREPWETRSGKEKIVAFALSCRKDVPAGTGVPLPKQAAKAQKFLDGLDPEFVQFVRRNIGGLQPQPKPAANAKENDGRS